VALIRTYGYWILVCISAFIYFLFAYKFERTEHLEILTSFGILAVFYFLLYKRLSRSRWFWLFGIGLTFRLIFIVASPQLSDDYFRFVWDGELTKDAYSAFAFVPSEYKKNVAQKHQQKYARMYRAKTESFPDGMNSRGYYSIYPTVNQFVFFTSALGNDPFGLNLVLLRIWVIIAEIVSFFLLRYLLKSTRKESWLGLYWLNPLVIIELSGNLHMEALAITFILAALVFAQRNSLFGTALSVVLAVMTKITPLLILGAMFKQFSWKRWLVLCSVTAVFSIALFSLVVSVDTFANFKESVGLFFAWFSFNAGVYYSFRDITLVTTGVNISAQLSLFFPFISAAIMLWWTFFGKREMITTALLIFTTYFMFTPILHPWYITVLIPLGILSGRMYPLVWSVLIFGSYMAYGDSFQEPLWWIYTEFALVLFLMFSEFRTRENLVQRWSAKLYA